MLQAQFDVGRDVHLLQGTKGPPAGITEKKLEKSRAPLIRPPIDAPPHNAVQLPAAQTNFVSLLGVGPGQEPPADSPFDNVLGSEGNDVFNVYRNVAPLRAEGGSGNDTLIDGAGDDNEGQGGGGSEDEDDREGQGGWGGSGDDA